MTDFYRWPGKDEGNVGLWIAGRGAAERGRKPTLTDDYDYMDGYSSLPSLTETREQFLARRATALATTGARS